MQSFANPGVFVTLRSSSSKSSQFRIQSHLASALSALSMPLHIFWGVGVEGRIYVYRVRNSTEVPRAFGESGGILGFLYRSDFLPQLFSGARPFFLHLCSSLLCLCSSVSLLWLTLHIAARVAFVGPVEPLYLPL